MGQSEADFWANQIVAAVQYCRSKANPLISSGQKASPAVAEMVKLLGKSGLFHLPIWKGATRSPRKKKVNQSPVKFQKRFCRGPGQFFQGKNEHKGKHFGQLWNEF